MKSRATHLGQKIAWPLLAGLLMSLAACPAQVEHVDPAKGEHGPKTSPDDPRVVQVGEDLYAKEAASNPEPPAATGSPGTGAPDETNGECRLFAPKLPNPKCCAKETGFDAEAAREICGHDVYLGESIRASCGYFFMPEGGGKPVSMRATHVLGEDARTAAEQEAMRLNFQMSRRDLKVEPVPGVPGAFMIKDKRLRWAFIPGWKAVRQFAWLEESCADEKVPQLIKIMAEAVQPPKDTKRPMIPRARKPGEPFEKVKPKEAAEVRP